jgi:hypothetical protein
VDVQTGTLQLNRGGDSTGSFTVASGATLGFSGVDTILRAASAVAGDGTVRASTTGSSDSTLTILGGYSVATTTVASGTVNFARDVSVANLTLSGGSLTGLGPVTVTGVMNWTGGTLSGIGTTTVAASAVLNLRGGTLDGYTLNNAGRVVWTQGTFSFSHGAVFNNLATGTFEARTASSLGGSTTVIGTFNNAGAFLESLSSGQTSVDIVFNNTGSVEVQAGVLQLGDGRSSGAFAVDRGATLTFAFGPFGGNHLFSGDSTFSGDGNVQFSSGTCNVLGRFAMGGTVTIALTAVVYFSSDVNLRALTLVGLLTGSGNVTVSGSLLWTGGFMTGTGITTSNGTLVMGGLDFKEMSLQRILNNAGVATWTGNSTVSLGNGGDFNNLAGARFLEHSTGGFGSVNSGVFNNAGDFDMNANSSGTAFGVRFNNTGTVEVETGPLGLFGSGTIGGSISVSAGATLEIGGASLLDASVAVEGAGSVQFDSGSNATILTSSWTVANILIGGAVNFAGDVHLLALTLDGGALTGTGNVTIEGRFTWNGGVMTGAGTTTIAASAVLNLRGGTLDGRTIDNAGQTLWTQGNIQVSNRGVFNNLDTGSFVTTDSNFSEFFGSNGTFNNTGAFVKSQSSSQAGIYITFNNTGSVEVQTGTLEVGAGSSSGAFAVDAGATLTFASSQLLTADSAVFGDGNVQFSNGTTNVFGYFGPAGTVTVNNGIVNFWTDIDLEALTLQGGTLTGIGNVSVEGPFVWIAGTMSGLGVTNVNSTLVLNGGILDGRTLNNAGTATWMGNTNIAITPGGVFDNLPGAEFLVRGNGAFTGNVAGAGVFENAGDFDKSASSGTTSLGVQFNNTGAVEVETGTLSLTGSGENAGSISVAAGATLQFTSGSYILDTSSSVDAAGTVQFGTPSGGSTTALAGSWTVANTLISNGTVNIAVDVDLPVLTLDGGALTGAGNVTVENTFTWDGGAMTGVGTTTSLGVATLSGSPNNRDLNGRSLVNAGTLTWTGSGGITVRNGAVLDNQPGAVFTIHSDQLVSGGNFGDTPGTIVNEGTLIKEASTQITIVAVPLVSTGTVQLRTGTLSVRAGYLQQAGSTELSSGTMLDSQATQVDIEGGVLTGTGTINGNLVNGGLVTPGGDGTAGILTVTGSYTQSGSGVLSIDLGGLTAGSEYDQLRVSGGVTLDGMLRVQLINGFQPFPGDTFNILTFFNRIGDFAVDLLPDLGTNRTMTPTFSATGLSLVVSQT